MPPGQVPNRSDDLSRARDANRSNRPELKRGELRPVTRPEPDASWHPIAKMMYESLSTSGQSDFYQDSDWAIAFSICEELSVYKRSGYTNDKGEWVPKRNGQILAAIMSTMTSLMATEGDRRRLRVELSEAEVVDDSTVSAMEDYRAKLKGTAT